MQDASVMTDPELVEISTKLGVGPGALHKR